MFLVDFEQGRLIPDEELKAGLRPRRPYGEWLQRAAHRAYRIFRPQEEPHGFDPETLLPRMQAFGYTTETLQFMLLPLVRRAARSGRFDGQRRGAGLPVRQAADALRLLSSSCSPR